MTEPETSLIRSISPKREWLLRCHDSDLDLACCSIVVEHGKIEIICPDNQDQLVLGPVQIADFHAALHEAITLAETDLRIADERRRAEAG
jgi:hypothetical protein